MTAYTSLNQSTARDAWRKDARAWQQEALPDGPTVVSCSAPLGRGGLGRHLAEVVAALQDAGKLVAYIAPGCARGENTGAAVTVQLPGVIIAALRAPPFRFSHGWRVHLGNAGFDLVAAAKLPRRAGHLLVFNGHALRHEAAARRIGYSTVDLIAANGHLAHTAAQHQKAYSQYPIERPWGPHNLRRNLKEYDAVDRIYVASQYAWDTFAYRGFPEERLRLFPLIPHQRFQPRTGAPNSQFFNVIYVGSLSVHKGVPLLIDAFRRLPYDDARLVLVGGYGSRGMRRYLQSARAHDSRISVRPGDPLPHLQQASVYVHPTYEDGFGYAPAEALACGVPVIVTEDTGMKTLIRPGVDGIVIPTGELRSLSEALDASYRGEWAGVSAASTCA